LIPPRKAPTIFSLLFTRPSPPDLGWDDRQWDAMQRTTLSESFIRRVGRQ
jgi:hypothetical protein